MKNKGITILLLVIIISAIFISVLVAAEIMIRQAHILQSFNFSEKARLAALAGEDAAAFAVYESYCQVDTTNCNVEGTLPDGSQYSTLVTINTKEPDTGQENFGQEITFSNPWEIKLKANKSFTFYMDLNSQNIIYPQSLIIGETTSTGQLSFYQSSKNPVSWQLVSSTTTFPVTLNLAVSSSYYYALTITNGDTDNIYSLTPSNDNPVHPTCWSEYCQYRNF